MLEEARRDYVFSAYQFHGESDRGIVSLAGGVESHWKGGADVTASTYFDIGSVTKAVATTSLCALAVDKGELRLESPVGDHVAELSDCPLGKIEVADLLAHSSGCEAWLPVGEGAGKGDLAKWYRANAARVQPKLPGQKAVYSDVGYLLLGLVLKSVVGDLRRAFADRVAVPLGLAEVIWGPTSAPCAATEYHLERKKVLRGEVFDDNCHLLGGVSAHAGLFATASGLAAWAREWLSAWRGKSRWLSEKSARLFTARSRRAPDSPWALGWDTPSDVGSSAGSGFSKASFGHLGYPGCSVWIDPQASHFAILLTNRVHPSRHDERVRELRPKVHDAWTAFCHSARGE